MAVRRAARHPLALTPLWLVVPWGDQALRSVPFELAQPILDLGETTTLEVLADFDLPVLGFGIDLVLDDAVLGVGLLEIGPAFTPVFAPDGDGLAGLEPFSGLADSDVLLARLEVTRVGLAGTSITGAVTPGDLTEGFPLLGGGFDGQEIYARSWRLDYSRAAFSVLLDEMGLERPRVSAARRATARTGTRGTAPCDQRSADARASAGRGGFQPKWRHRCRHTARVRGRDRRDRAVGNPEMSA